MADETWYPSVADVPASLWPGDAGVPIDRSKRFRQFRDNVIEGGETFVLVVPGSPDPVLASGFVTSAATGLFSDPWKMLTNDQFLRLEGLAAAEADEIVARRDALLHRLTGRDGPVGAAGLHERLGGCLTVRGLDSSELFHGDGAPVSAKEADALLAVLRDRAQQRGLGVALPFVDRADGELRTTLAQAGFVFGAVTAVNLFDLPVGRSFDEVLTGLPGRVRYRFRKEWKDFHAAGYTLHELDLARDVEEVVGLESRNRLKHGGRADRERLTGLRLTMARLFPGDLRAKGVRDAGGDLVAMGLDLVDEHGYYGLVYGQDEDRVNEYVYPALVYDWPLRYSLERGFSHMHMGFEAFAPKTLRGARLEKRIFAFWHPEPGVRETAGALLSLAEERLERGVLAAARTAESAAQHWSFVA